MMFTCFFKYFHKLEFIDNLALVLDAIVMNDRPDLCILPLCSIVQFQNMDMSVPFLFRAIVLYYSICSCDA